MAQNERPNLEQEIQGLKARLGKADLTAHKTSHEFSGADPVQLFDLQRTVEQISARLMLLERGGFHPHAFSHEVAGSDPLRLPIGIDDDYHQRFHRLNIGSNLVTSTVNGELTLSAFADLVYKASNETVNNSNTVQDDNDLSFAIGANEIFTWQTVLFFTSSAVADFRLTFTVPAGATVRFGGMGNSTALVMVVGVASASGTELAFGGNGATEMMVNVWGYVANGATAGTVQLQWAQNTPEVSDTILLAGSTLSPIQIA
jgi:hypothetical protein